MRELRRAGDRFLTEVDGITTWHSFSHGVHYDPSNVAFGPLMAINVEHVAPGAGYERHRHADVEIVTWVVDGVLAHADTVGNDGQVRPSTAQRLSAGTGVEHAERNASDEPLVFVQTVLRSTHDREPRYASVEVAGDGLLPGVDVAGPARMLVARPAGTAVEVPAATRTLVHVTRGSIVVGDERLDVGDELRTDEPVGAVDGSGEALVWLLDNAP
ncbi:pirin family protein [Aeromicrobium halocynthiae]|uniref:Pirin family protein n=1 Tax=Aeromicrobium halocynthiae TaxID=560557 RepID=A0ABP5HV37_9ACTN